MKRRDFLLKAALVGGGLGLSSLPFLAGCTSDGAKATAAAGAGGAAPQKRLKAAMSNAGLQSTWCSQGKDAAEQFCKWLGIDLTWYDGQLSVDKQRAAIEDMASKDWDFVALQPLGIGTLVDPIQKMIDKGIPVISMDTLIAPLGELKIHTFIAPDNLFMAESVVEALMRAINGQGNVIMTQGHLGHTGAQGRTQGFYNVAKRYPGVKVLDESPADWDMKKAADLWEDLLTRFPKIDGAFFHSDDMAAAALEVIKRRNRTEIKVVSVDGQPSALEAVAKGEMLATVRNPAGRIHWGAVVAGYFAATQKERNIPEFVLADGPVISKVTPQKSDKPWLLPNYGLSAAEGLLWKEKHFLI